MEDFYPFLGMTLFFGVLAYIVKIISDNRIRRRLIESGQLDEKIKYLYFRESKSLSEPFNSVRWGLVLIALGLAVLIGQLFPPGDKEQMTVSAMFIMAGLAFLVYYFLAKREIGRKSSAEAQD
jgi:hypothetical protein